MAISSIKPIEVGHDSELRRLAEEVRATGEPRLLRVAGRDVALIVPIAPAEKVPTEEDIAAFRAAFGSWAGNVDTEKLKEELARERGSDLPSAVP